MIVKSNALAVAGVLAALVTAAATLPAAAKDNTAPGYETCYSLAIDRGAGPNMGGGNKEHSQHKAFMDQCMSGKLPMTAGSTPSVAKAQSTPSVAGLQGNAYASTASSRHINRRPGISKAAS
jgi:hypothetical protein